MRKIVSEPVSEVTKSSDRPCPWSHDFFPSTVEPPPVQNVGPPKADVDILIAAMCWDVESESTREAIDRIKYPSTGFPWDPWSPAGVPSLDEKYPIQS